MATVVYQTKDQRNYLKPLRARTTRSTFRVSTYSMSERVFPIDLHRAGAALFLIPTRNRLNYAISVMTAAAEPHSPHPQVHAGEIESAAWGILSLCPLLLSVI